MGRQHWQSLSSSQTSLSLGLFFLCVFLLLSCAKAENITDPTGNLNLNPIQASRSSEYCLWNNTGHYCADKFNLSHSGWLNISHADGPEFCASGCAEHTRIMLLCLKHVKRDYQFENGASIHNLNETINIGCDSPQGFNGTSLHSAAGFGLYSAPIFTALSAIALLLNIALF